MVCESAVREVAARLFDEDELVDVFSMLARGEVVEAEDLIMGEIAVRYLTGALRFGEATWHLLSLGRSAVSLLFLQERSMLARSESS